MSPARDAAEPPIPPGAAASGSLEALKPQLIDVLRTQSVVLAAPTGTGKSTQVPRWLPGRVLVIQPRRLACQALATRVAHLQGSRLGEDVGYLVRDDRRASASTRVLFATPGIVLQKPSMLADFDSVVLDEFHERRVDIDWLAAYLHRKRRHFVVMSATLEGRRLASHLGAALLTATATAHPIDIEYLSDDHAALPTADGLARRALEAVRRASARPGDVLVFLPGKAEIHRCLDAFPQSDFSVFPLHGGLSLEDQARVFAPSARRKLIFSTNVAETSLTLPGVRTVIDSGLVRRTRYHEGRAHLALGCIALDSAAQRAGRAGRTAPGAAYRLWGPSAQLSAHTPPEVHREPLSEMLLYSAACGLSVSELPLLDAPKPYAIEAAGQELRSLGALDERGGITELGRTLHELPIDLSLGRLLVEAERRGQLAVMIELVATLSHGSPITLPEPEPESGTPPCDAVGLLAWLRGELGRTDAGRRREVRRSAERLRAAMGQASGTAAIDRKALLQCVIAADPRRAYVARRRKRGVAFSAGGTELSLSPASWAQLQRESDALVVLQSIATGSGRDKRLIATRASAVPAQWLAEMDLGDLRLRDVRFRPPRLTARVERVYAGRVIGVEPRELTGQAARDAARLLFLEGRLFPEALRESRENDQRWALVPTLLTLPNLAGAREQHYPRPPPLDEWVRVQLETLGVESGEDLELLNGGDLTYPSLPGELEPTMREQFPLTVSTGDCTYAVQYDLQKKRALLSILVGSRAAPPPASFLPPLGGFQVCVEAGGGLHVVRQKARR